MSKTSPLRGWFLDQVVELDESAPGFAGAMFRASNERRNVVAAYLASRTANTQFTGASLGRFLEEGRHDVILRAAYPSVPRGFRAALGRCGPQPFKPSFYRYLHALLTSSVRPEMAGLIRSLPSLDPIRLKVVRALSPDLRLSGVVQALSKPEDARDFSRLVTLLQRAGADRALMVEALSRVRSFEGLRTFATRWSFKLTLPDHPVPDGLGYRALRTTSQVKSVAKSFRNCMAGYVSTALEADVAFSLVEVDGVSAVAFLRRKNGRWRLDDVYGKDNRPPPRACEELAEQHLAKFGIVRVREEYAAKEWSCLRRFTRHVDYEHLY